MFTDLLKRVLLSVDVPLLLGIFVLCGLGMMNLYSASGQSTVILHHQLLRFMIGLLALLFVTQIPPLVLARHASWLYLISVGLLVWVLFYGVGTKGAERWLDIKLFYFQPSELFKIILPLVLARYLSARRLPPSVVSVLVIILLIALPVWLIVKQPDLGTGLLVALVGLSILFMAGLSWRWWALSGLAGVLVTPLMWYSLHDYQRRRILTFLNPEQDALGMSYHIIQSKIAIGSGGLYGKGWLNGTQSRLEFIPERSTDFVFAVFCEEFGFMGVLLLVLICLFLVTRGGCIALVSRDVFSRLLGCGLMVGFFLYVFINMAMVCGLLPVVGIPLPLLSLGGTSMLTVMVAFGMVMAMGSRVERAKF